MPRECGCRGGPGRQQGRQGAQLWGPLPRPLRAQGSSPGAVVKGRQDITAPGRRGAVHMGGEGLVLGPGASGQRGQRWPRGRGTWPLPRLGGSLGAGLGARTEGWRAGRCRWGRDFVPWPWRSGGPSGVPGGCQVWAQPCPPSSSLAGPPPG